MQYCFLQHWTLLLSPVTSTTGYCFCFGSIHSFFSGVISLLISCSILHTYWPGEFLFQYPIILPFHTVYGVLKAKHIEVVCHSLLQWTTFCQNSPPWPACLGWPHKAWLSFIELDKAVVLVELDWLVFCDYGLCVYSLMPLTTPTIFFGFLLPWTWCISSGLLQQSTAAALYLDEGYLFTAVPPDLERGIAPLGPMAPVQPLLLGHGVAPPSRHPWPRAGVAPLGCSCAVIAWHSRPPSLTLDAG